MQRQYMNMTELKGLMQDPKNIPDQTIITAIEQNTWILEIKENEVCAVLLNAVAAGRIAIVDHLIENFKKYNISYTNPNIPKKAITSAKTDMLKHLIQKY